MFEVRDGIILTDEPYNIYDTEKIVILFDNGEHGERGRVSLVRRNKPGRSVYWQISSRTIWRDYLCFVDNGASSTRENLIDLLRSDWPEDFIWLLFHLEIFDGEWND